MNNDVLGDLIAEAALCAFSKLTCKSGKPSIRSNGVQEWTVMASVVAIMDNETIEPLTIATGVKVMPNRVRAFSQGFIVHDMHAEILALRLFNFFLLHECAKESSIWVEQGGSNAKYRLKPSVKLALFVTEPPCGDCSMEYLASSLDSNEPWTEQAELFLNDQFHRGRNNFDRVGVVRTKPGRPDSLISYSKSCSDKLCLKQLTGICNTTTALIFDPIYLDYLVVNGVKTKNFERCFINRLSGIEPRVHHLKLLHYTNDGYEYHKAQDKEPSPVSLLYIVPSQFVQVLNNGIKNGAAAAKNKTPKAGTESIICNQSFITAFNKLISTPSTIASPTYLQLKRSQVNRERLKNIGKTTLQNWKPTDDDEFSII